jgi:hypothetical protein
VFPEELSKRDGDMKGPEVGDMNNRVQTQREGGEEPGGPGRGETLVFSGENGRGEAVHDTLGKEGKGLEVDNRAMVNPIFRGGDGVEDERGGGAMQAFLGEVIDQDVHMVVGVSAGPRETETA